jgi:hypothetical protein
MPNGELGQRMGKGYWSAPEPKATSWQEGLPEGWTMHVKSHEQVQGMTTKVRELTVVIEITAPSGHVHVASTLLVDKLPEKGYGGDDGDGDGAAGRPVSEVGTGLPEDAEESSV